MKKVTTLALVGLLGVSAGAYATEARDLGFGAASQFIVSDSSYTTLPQEVLTYKDNTYLELGSNNLYVPSDNYSKYNSNQNVWGGANVSLGSGALGIWVGRPNNDFSGLYNNSQLQLNGTVANGMGNLLGIGAGNTIADFMHDGDTAQDRVDVIYAFDLTEMANLAIGINRANYDYKADFGSTGYNSWNSQNLGLSLGSDIKGLDPVKLLQVGLQVNMESQAADANNGVDNKFISNATDVQLRVGGDVAGDNGRFGRAELGVGIGSLQVKTEPNGGTTYADNGFATTYNVGYAVGMTKDKSMALAGLMVYGDLGNDDNTALVPGEKYSYNDINVVLSTGGETKLTSWLTARCGLRGSLFSMGSEQHNTTKSAGNPQYSYSPDYAQLGGNLNIGSSATASLGLSLNFGNLTLDGVLNQNVLYSGTYLASGIPEALFSQVSATYSWM